MSEIKAIYSDGMTTVEGWLIPVLQIHTDDKWSWVFKHENSYYHAPNGPFSTKRQAIQNAFDFGITAKTGETQ